MKKLLCLSLTILLLSACVHKMDIEQGNIMAPDQVSRLHTGMTMAQVKNLLGTPMLMNTFNDNRVNYVYTLQKGGKLVTERHLILTFRGGVLREIKQSE